MTSSSEYRKIELTNESANMVRDAIMANLEKDPEALRRVYSSMAGVSQAIGVELSSYADGVEQLVVNGVPESVFPRELLLRAAKASRAG